MNDLNTLVVRRIFWGLFLILLVLGVFTVLKPFFVSIIWACILGYTTWPLFLKMEKITGQKKALASGLMVGLIAMILVLPFVWLSAVLRTESMNLLDYWASILEAGKLEVPSWIRSIPFLGHEISKYLEQIFENPTQIRSTFLALLPNIQKSGFFLLGALGRHAAILVLSLFVLFFVFNQGKHFIEQSRRVLTSLIGYRAHAYLQAVGTTTRGVVYGVVLTALIQGVLTGLGCWVAGVPSPVTLAAATVLIALIPFGTPLVWGSAALWLWFSGQTFASVGLALWGILVISWVDNIIRPMALSGAANIPFVLALFGVLGGLATFGVVGLFLGPIILTIALAVWREWLSHPDNEDTQSATQSFS